MKIKDLCKSLILLLLFVGSTVTIAAQNVQPFVIPELKEWKGKVENFIPTTATKIICDTKDKELLHVAQLFASDYETMFGQQLKISSGKAAKGDFVFKIEANKKMEKEEYVVSIAHKVTASAATYTGIYWSTRTLLQLAEQSQDHSLPMGYIKDYPDYEIRGLMMDCGRKFIPMSYLKDLVKVMSYYKLNTFQIHLNDNGFKEYFQNDWAKTPAAFRLECDTYQGLTSRDGFYTKKEFLQFQKESFAQCVEIIPEIDSPAHTLAFTHYKPEIGSKEYGMDHLDLFNPETYTFMDALFKEYLEGEDPIFYGPKVHIGTDEYSNKDRAVVEKFREYTQHYIQLVESYGKQACLWGALTHAAGNTKVKSENVIMSAWYNDFAQPKEMVKKGFKLISVPGFTNYIVPSADYFHDYLNAKELYNEWTPAHIDNEVFQEKDPAVMGGMFAVWNDHVGNGISVKDIHHRTFPAVQTLSAKMWGGKQVSVPFEVFNQKRCTLSEAPGVNQLAKIGDKPALVFEAQELKPGMSTPYTEIGYDYTVTFDITETPEEKGTALFCSPDAVFYLSDPISGSMGFARDGYLSTFRFQLYEGEQAHVEIHGNHERTILKVNGKIVSDLYKEAQFDFNRKNKLNRVHTLVFPLQKAGLFKSKICHLKVYNYNK